jgi:hypothetical protein
MRFPCHSCIGILAAVALVMTTSSTWAEDWHAASNYPARAIAFQFGSGTLDRTHSIRFGSWTVSFRPQEIPIMSKMAASGTYGTQNRSDGTMALVCANAVAGQSACAIAVSSAQQGRRQDACTLLIFPETSLPIPCPTSITFQP